MNEFDRNSRDSTNLRILEKFCCVPLPDIWRDLVPILKRFCANLGVNCWIETEKNCFVIIFYIKILTKFIYKILLKIWSIIYPPKYGIFIYNNNIFSSEILITFFGFKVWVKQALFRQNWFRKLQCAQKSGDPFKLLCKMGHY